jgi:hypothetical protein
MNWLQVSASTKRPEIEEREGDKFEPKLTTLFGLKAQQQACELILPGKGALPDEAQFVERGSEEAGPPLLGRLPGAGILLDGGLHRGIADPFAIGFTVKSPPPD